MNDLLLGVVIILALTVASFWFAAFCAKRVVPRVIEQLALLTVLGMVLYIWQYWDDVQMAHWLPYSNMIILSNLFTPMMGYLAGLVWVRLKERPKSQRVIFVTGLLLAGFYGLVYPILGISPECENKWFRNVCLQTTNATCSAAAAATVLVAHGIPASEQEMADLCLTRTGTTWKGLYRGLKLKTAGTEWDVEPFSMGIAELKQTTGPFILRTGLPADGDYPPVYEEEWGWVPGQPHSVVLFGFSDQGVGYIGDPSTGVELWAPEVFDTLYQGEGVRLIPRTSSEASGE